MISHGGPELFVAFIVAVITPILYRLVLRRFRLGVRIISILVLWAFTIVVAYWDVYQISKEARRLCKEEAGLHVNKTVEADGFLGSVSGIEKWSIYGFQYVEGLYKGQKSRAVISEGGILYETVPEYSSRYQSISEDEKLKEGLVKNKRAIVDRDTGEVLGEEIAITVYPGWLDSRLIGILGFTWTPPRCDGDYFPERGKTILQYDDLIKSVIKPKSLNR